jgi:hypothetical protein
MPATPKHIQNMVDAWNRQHPIGSHMLYYPVRGRSEHREVQTVSMAWALPSGHIVVKINGQAGGVSIGNLVDK